MSSPFLRKLKLPLWIAGCVGVLALGLTVQAADHADSPDTDQGNLDINDLYAFVDGENLVLAMTVAPLLSPGELTDNAALNPNGLYEFHLDVERDGVAEGVIQVVAQGTGDDQKVTVIGPAAPTGGATSSRIADATHVRGDFGSMFSGGGMTVFTGPRDDPFYINLFGDESLTSVLNAAYGAAVGMQIGADDEQTLAFADPGEDDLAGLNTLSIVVSIPKTAVASALGVPSDATVYAWATAGERQ